MVKTNKMQRNCEYSKCDIDISHLHANAKYCSDKHKLLAREENNLKKKLRHQTNLHNIANRLVESKSFMSDLKKFISSIDGEISIRYLMYSMRELFGYSMTNGIDKYLHASLCSKDKNIAKRLKPIKG